MKRQLQYSQSKKTKQHRVISLSPHTLALTYPHSSSLLPHLLLLSTYYFLLRASCYACSYLVSASWHECFSHALYLAIHVYFTCMACILLPLPYTFPYCTCTLLISCFVAPCILYMILVTLCSVPVQRTSRQS